jgi:hypothetical protein
LDIDASLPGGGAKTWNIHKFRFSHDLPARHFNAQNCEIIFFTLGEGQGAQLDLPNWFPSIN